MTVISLVSDKDTVVLAADRQFTYDTDLIYHDSKIRKLLNHQGKLIGAIATAGDSKVGFEFEEHLQTLLKSVQLAANFDPLQVLQLAVTHPELKEIPCGLAIIQGVGYYVDEDAWAVSKDRWSIGSGGTVALGAMWARKGTAKNIALHGCKAAIALTASCSGEIDTFSMDRKS